MSDPDSRHAAPVSTRLPQGAKPGHGGVLRGLFAVERIEHADQHGTALERRHLGFGRRLHLEHDVGGESGRLVGQFRAGCGVGFVGIAGGHAGAACNAHAMAGGRVFLDGLGRRGNARLVRPCFGGHSDVHLGFLQ